MNFTSLIRHGLSFTFTSYRPWHSIIYTPSSLSPLSSSHSYSLSCILNLRLLGKNPFHHRPFPLLSDWFHRLSDHLTFYFALPSARQHPSYGDCLETRADRPIIRTALCWVVCHDVHSQQHTNMSSSYRSSRLSFSHWDPYAWHPGLVYQALSARPAGFLQCLDTVGLVLWPAKIVPDMTYNVFVGTFRVPTTL